MTELRALTAAEAARPYAKYYARPMTPVNNEIYDAIEAPADAALALPLARINDLLEPGERALERGWCLMDDGSCFVAGRTDMPGVTTEMLEWWFAWHGLESLRYAIWDPEEHYAVRVTPETIARRFDQSLSWRERNWNTTDVVTEDVGTGTVMLDINFRSPEFFGYDMARFEAGGFSAINAIVGMHGLPPMIAFSHNARPVNGGIELRSCFWLGWTVENGRYERAGAPVPQEEVARLAKALAKHCAKEYRNLAAILRDLYAENHGIKDLPEDFINS